MNRIDQSIKAAEGAVDTVMARHANTTYRTDYRVRCDLELERLQDALQAKQSVWGWLWLNAGAIAAVIATGLVLMALWETFKP